jgi:hypothetical protein
LKQDLPVSRREVTHLTKSFKEGERRERKRERERERRNCLGAQMGLEERQETYGTHSAYWYLMHLWTHIRRIEKLAH